MEREFQRLHHQEVVSVNLETLENLEVSNTFKVIQLLEAIRKLVGFDASESSLFDGGISCEVLRFRSGNWQKGKVRLTLEFTPDEPESPLEEIEN